LHAFKTRNEDLKAKLKASLIQNSRLIKEYSKTNEDVNADKDLIKEMMDFNKRIAVVSQLDLDFDSEPEVSKRNQTPTQLLKETIKLDQHKKETQEIET